MRGDLILLTIVITAALAAMTRELICTKHASDAQMAALLQRIDSEGVKLKLDGVKEAMKERDAKLLKLQEMLAKIGDTLQGKSNLRMEELAGVVKEEDVDNSEELIRTTVAYIPGESVDQMVNRISLRMEEVLTNQYRIEMMIAELTESTDEEDDEESDEYHHKNPYPGIRPNQGPPTPFKPPMTLILLMTTATATLSPTMAQPQSTTPPQLSSTSQEAPSITESPTTASPSKDVMERWNDKWNTLRKDTASFGGRTFEVAIDGPDNNRLFVAKTDDGYITGKTKKEVAQKLVMRTSTL